MGNNGVNFSGRSVEDVWKEYKEGANGHTEAIRNFLVEKYFALVKYHAERFHKRVPPEVEKDDLVSAGVFGLLDAIEGFDLARGLKFETYCVPRIRGAILDEIRLLDWIPRLTRFRAKKIERMKSAFRLRFGREPSEEEVRAELKLPEEEYQKIIGDCKTVKVISHSRKVSQSDTEEGGGELIDVLVGTQSEECSNEFTEEERKYLRDLLMRGLNRAQRLVITLYHCEGYTMRETSDFLLISESRASQIHDAAVQLIKSNPSTKELWNEYIRQRVARVT